ncbi:MAG: hypothetical protein GX883_01030, partial [Firmicutes bacterium]|nr:hypothetical protein [Bacillota bacterium]
MDNLTVSKIKALISTLEKKRANYYPAGWDADPLYEVIAELRQIVAGMHGEAAPALRRVETAG